MSFSSFISKSALLQTRMCLIIYWSFNVNIFCLQLIYLKDFQWHTLLYYFLSFLNDMQLPLNESQYVPTGCFFPLLYFWFATFTVQFNGNVLSGQKIAFYLIMWPCTSEVGFWMEMEMFHMLSIRGSVRHDNLSFCVKSREGGCNCNQEKGEAQSHRSEPWGAFSTGAASLGWLNWGGRGGVAFDHTPRSGLCSLWVGEI